MDSKVDTKVIYMGFYDQYLTINWIPLLSIIMYNCITHLPLYILIIGGRIA